MWKLCLFVFQIGLTTIQKDTYILVLLIKCGILILILIVPCDRWQSSCWFYIWLLHTMCYIYIGWVILWFWKNHSFPANLAGGLHWQIPVPKLGPGFTLSSINFGLLINWKIYYCKIFRTRGWCLGLSGESLLPQRALIETYIYFTLRRWRVKTRIYDLWNETMSLTPLDQPLGVNLRILNQLKTAKS